MMTLVRQHVKDYIRARRNGILPPALWETRAWLKATRR